MVLTYAGLLDYSHSDSELEASASQALTHTLRQQTTCTLKKVGHQVDFAIKNWPPMPFFGKKVEQKTKKKLDSKQRIHA